MHIVLEQEQSARGRREGGKKKEIISSNVLGLLQLQHSPLLNLSKRD